MRDIRSVSVKNASDMSLKEVIDGFAGYKIVSNEKINSAIHPYQYVFALRNPKYNLQFIDLEPRNQKRILIEFNDAQNFLSVLKQRMAEVKIEVEAENKAAKELATQNEKEIGELIEQLKNM